MKIKLIENWKQCYKLLTVQAALLISLIATAYEYIPQFQQYLPEGWFKYFALVIIIARVINQTPKDEQ
jgi:hypothetical protein